MSFVETPHGWEWQNADIHVFFGGKSSARETLRKHYPHYSFNGVHQIHSPLVVEDTGLDSTQVQADGLFTKLKQRALCVVSADCVPILIHDVVESRVFALHAGWRGVASRILPQALHLISKPEALRAWVGPHIQQASFEVRDDALELLRQSTQLPSNSFAQPKDGGSFLVDLNQILVSQFNEFGVQPSQIQFLNLDTMTDPRLHSHRRDAKNAGRQNSFIVLKS